MACKFSNFFANIKILRPPIAKIFYQAASFTYLYWSGMGCGHGMPCPYLWRCGRGARYYFHMEGCGGEVDAWGFLFEAREVGASMSPSGAHLRRACLGLIALRLSEPFGICDATLTQRRDTACRVRIRRQRRPWRCTGREWVADTACRVPT